MSVHQRGGLSLLRLSPVAVHVSAHASAVVNPQPCSRCGDGASEDRAVQCVPVSFLLSVPPLRGFPLSHLLGLRPSANPALLLRRFRPSLPRSTFARGRFSSFNSSLCSAAVASPCARSPVPFSSVHGARFGRHLPSGGRLSPGPWPHHRWRPMSRGHVAFLHISR